MSGGLALSHKLVLKTRDYPGNPGEVMTSYGDDDTELRIPSLAIFCLMCFWEIPLAFGAIL